MTLPIIVARAVGSAEESVCVTTLGDVNTDSIDMRTLIIVGATTTVTYPTDVDKQPRVFTSRRYGTSESGE